MPSYSYMCTCNRVTIDGMLCMVILNTCLFMSHTGVTYHHWGTSWTRADLWRNWIYHIHSSCYILDQLVTSGVYLVPKFGYSSPIDYLWLFLLRSLDFGMSTMVTSNHTSVQWSSSDQCLLVVTWLMWPRSLQMGPTICTCTCTYLFWINPSFVIHCLHCNAHSSTVPLLLCTLWVYV